MGIAADKRPVEDKLRDPLIGRALFIDGGGGRALVVVDDGAGCCVCGVGPVPGNPPCTRPG